MIRCMVGLRPAPWSTIRCMQIAPRPASYNWFWIASLWAGLAILDAMQNVFTMRLEGMHHAWGKLFIVLTFEWLPWVLVTPSVISLARRYPPAWKSPLTWLLHFGVPVAIDVAASAWASALEGLIQPWLPDYHSRAFLVTWPLKIYGGLLPAFILYAVILAVTYVLDSRARAAAQQTDLARLNEQLSYAQLNALQRQIEPHFIFNALNSISSLVRERKSDAAVSMIVALSDFLRRVAVSSHDPEVQLSQEVDFLEKYLQIQEARFAGRLKLDIQVPDELRKARIPSLILQPLVENAIKHGIAQRVQGGEVRVAASRSDGLLHLSVYNDGPLLDRDGGAVKHGIGLSNLHTRLKLLYGSDCELRLDNYGITGVQASVALPYREV